MLRPERLNPPESLPMPMQLIGTVASPYVRKVRVVLAEKKLECEFVIDDVWDEASTLPQHNPLGKVPCLLVDGKEAIYDSRVIVEYLDTLSPVGKLIPASGRDRLEVKIWEALADGLQDAAITARMEQHWPGRSEGERSAAWTARQMKKVDDTLESMSERLGEQAWCNGGTHPTLADLATGCALAYLDYRFAEIPWRTRHPNLAALLDERLQPRPSFEATRLPD